MKGVFAQLWTLSTCRLPVFPNKTAACPIGRSPGAAGSPGKPFAYGSPGLRRAARPGCRQTDIGKVPEVRPALAGLKNNGRRLEECALAVGRLPTVLTTMIVTGRYDLMAVALASSRRTRVEFVTDQLAHVPGVNDSET